MQRELDKFKYRIFVHRAPPNQNTAYSPWHEKGLFERQFSVWFFSARLNRSVEGMCTDSELNYTFFSSIIVNFILSGWWVVVNLLVKRKF